MWSTTLRSSISVVDLTVKLLGPVCLAIVTLTVHNYITWIQCWHNNNYYDVTSNYHCLLHSFHGFSILDNKQWHMVFCLAHKQENAFHCFHLDHLNDGGNFTCTKGRCDNYHHFAISQVFHMSLIVHITKYCYIYNYLCIRGLNN